MVITRAKWRVCLLCNKNTWKSVIRTLFPTLSSSTKRQPPHPGGVTTLAFFIFTICQKHVFQLTLTDQTFPWLAFLGWTLHFKQQCLTVVIPISSSNTSEILLVGKNSSWIILCCLFIWSFACEIRTLLPSWSDSQFLTNHCNLEWFEPSCWTRNF